MSRNIESRVGGQSIESLIKGGFSAEGDFSHVRVFPAESGLIKVDPIVITEDYGKPDSKVITIFKPVRRRRFEVNLSKPAGK